MSITVEVDDCLITNEDVIRIVEERGLESKLLSNLENAEMLRCESFRAESAIRDGFIEYSFLLIINALPDYLKKELIGVASKLDANKKSH
jgi:hypothetical protein